jgi:D-glycero-D-manno-heptose 1,7-bisphosphate phosphatase
VVKSSEFPLTDDGIWCQVLRRPRLPARPRPALFVDRDGVVIEEGHFVHQPAEVRVLPGCPAAIRRANARGHPVVIVTNQSGIGRGYYGWPEFAATQERVVEDLAGQGAYVDAVLACPYHEDGCPPYNVADHPFRKPNPGMLTLAAQRLGLDLGGSWIVGDHATDIGAGRAAGLAGAVHVSTGHGSEPGQHERAASYASSGFQVLFAPSLTEAVDFIPFLKT